MAYFVGYFDESGKLGDKDVVSVAGFLADEYGWKKLATKWTSLLNRYHLTCFHCAEALRFKRPLSRKTPALGIEQRSKVLLQFINIIKDSVDYGIGFAVDARAFRSLTDKQQDKLGDPQFVAFRLILGALADHVHDDDTISIVLDDDDKPSVNCYKIFRTVRGENRRIKRKIISIGFGDDFYFPQIQAADLFAGLLRGAAEQEFMGKTFPFDSTFKSLLEQADPVARFEGEAYFYNKSDLVELAG